MEKVITFPTWSSKRSESRAPSMGKTADIIIFPGVRYEHYSTSPVEGGSRKSSSRMKSGPSSAVTKQG